MDLEQLVKRFKKKDVLAFERLYDMYSPNILGVIHTIVKDRARSEELCQDVFVKAWEKSDSYNASKGRFFTWILNIARNAAIDELRSKSYKNQKKNLSAESFVSILKQPEAITPSLDTSGLKKLLMDLTTKCLQIIEMLYFRGYTQKETAEELNIPLGTVKTRNRNCISKLRENMTLKWT